MYVWWKKKKKKKKNGFSLKGEEGFFFENQCTKRLIERLHFSSLDFWISLHQGTLSILCSRIQGYMLSFMNKIDSCLLLPLCILYEIQNQIFQQLVSERSSISCLYNMWLGSRIKENNFLGVFIYCGKFSA